MPASGFGVIHSFIHSFISFNGLDSQLKPFYLFEIPSYTTIYVNCIESRKGLAGELSI
jgi:hypothetical protein